MSLTFNGSAIYVYGAKRGNHGLYSVQVDDGSVQYQLGYSPDPAIQSLLYAQGGLSTDQSHTVVRTR
jgi:hypothetical protein